jgi:D-arabinan exo alpha-(1,3)/(1,5)-arabinofuranosidase (non-reducing end)
MRRSLFGAFLCCLGILCGSAASEVTFKSLVGEMTDLDALSRFPDPAYTCRQFSSYDQRSTDPSVLTDENWFANGDRGQHLREEERNGATEWVMMDAEGPGAIVRIWSANPIDAGLIRIYIDGATEPAIEMPLTTLLGGDAPFAPKPIAGERSRGWNCYLPIPYAKHCKVTASKPGFYYQINYRTYEPGTEVQSFSMALAEAATEVIGSAAASLAEPERYAAEEGVQKNVMNRALAPGASVGQSLRRRGAAICRFTAKVKADDMEAALRECLLEIAFDDAFFPSMCVPLGDFFGAAPGLNVHSGLPCGVLEDGTMYSNWVMPFESKVTIRLTNHAGIPVTVSAEYFSRPRAWTDRSMHFHAKWRGQQGIPTQPRQDWTYLDCKGKGVFVGDMLHVTNPVKQWWGEGDEKIYVDGETFPSHFGTGTEDYYGYAWCCNEVFTHAYHNQPRCDGPGNYGQTCVNRFHIIDNIPFTKSFKFDMEVWHWAKCEIAMAATSYWYALPGGTDSFKAPTPEDLTVVTPPPLPEPKRVKGAIEGEGLIDNAEGPGNIRTQESDVWEWSGAGQLWWTGAKPGDVLTIPFSAEAAGKHEVRAVFTTARDYGIVQLAVNDKNAGEPMDCYTPDVKPTAELSLGVHTLRKGDNELKVTITGKSDKAEPGYMFGLDYLLLKKAE